MCWSIHYMVTCSNHNGYMLNYVFKGHWSNLSGFIYFGPIAILLILLIKWLWYSYLEISYLLNIQANFRLFCQLKKHVEGKAPQCYLWVTLQSCHVLFLYVSPSNSDQIAIRQSQIDKLYAGLKDLAEERRARLQETTRLFALNQEVDDIEQWIAEREVVAGSHELGQDLEHVTVC